MTDLRIARDDPTVRVDRPSTFMYRMEAQLTDSVPIGLVPEGLRLDNSFVGAIIDGDLVGGQVRGVDYYLVRPDGVGVVDARETIVGDGYSIAAHARGFITPPKGLAIPPLEHLLTPGFVWPDVDFPLKVCQTYQTASIEHDQLNTTVASHVGMLNYATKRLMIDSYRLEVSAFPRLMR